MDIICEPLVARMAVGMDIADKDETKIIQCGIKVMFFYCYISDRDGIIVKDNPGGDIKGKVKDKDENNFVFIVAVFGFILFKYRIQDTFYGQEEQEEEGCLNNN